MSLACDQFGHDEYRIFVWFFLIAPAENTYSIFIIHHDQIDDMPIISDMIQWIMNEFPFLYCIASENLLIRFSKGNLPCLRCIEIVENKFLFV